MIEMYSGGKSCLPHGCQEAEVKEEWALSNLFPPTDPHLLRATEVCIDGQYLQFLSSSDSIWKHSHLLFHSYGLPDDIDSCYI